MTRREVFAEMIGETFVSLDGCSVRSERMTFVASDGAEFVFHYEQDCCATCSIEDVIGDASDLIGAPMLVAEEVSSAGEPAPPGADSYTWTFYRFATIKGSVTVRWLGESNGYYSESVTYTPPQTCMKHADCMENAKLGRACFATQSSN